MATIQEKAAFIAELDGAAAQAAKQADLNARKAEAAKKILEDGFPQSKRDELRQALTFSVERRDGKGPVQSMGSKDGSRKEIETEDAKSRYKALSPADAKKAQEGLETIVALKTKLLQARSDAGDALFSEEDLMDELFTPLVREGLMPENLVLDKNSEVHALLKNAVASYKTAFEEAKKKKAAAAAKAAVNRHGAAEDAQDLLEAYGAKMGAMVESVYGAVAARAGLTVEETKRLGAIGMGVGAVATSAATTSLAIMKADTYAQSGGGSSSEGNAAQIMTKDVAKTLNAAKSIVDLAMTAYDKNSAATDAKKEQQVGDRAPKLAASAIAMAERADDALETALLSQYPQAIGVLRKRFARHLKAQTLVDECAKPKLADAAARQVVVDALKACLTEAAKGIAQDALAKAFIAAGAAIAAEFAGKAQLPESLVMNTPEKAFDTFASVIGKAADAAFAAPSFKSAMAHKDAAGSLQASAKQSAEADVEAQLQRVEDERAQYEQGLVLVDEGGEEMARARSISQLIQELEDDRLTLNIVAKLGSVIGGFGGSVTTMAADAANIAAGAPLKQGLGAAETVASEVTQSLVPALKAAQLVVDMGVTVLRIQQRYVLVEKFKADIKKARSAKSPLLAAVQNFYSSKERQQIYDGIELALQTVQLAGAITASVPEPMTMAVGRAITASAGLARGATDLGHMLHDEKLLRSGWKKTLDALNNPANRRAGLDALHNNGTLAAHAVAWAAKDGDRMAREILNSCGVNEQTLADNQSDQEAVVAYLETRLYEDLQFKDDEKVKIDWAPTPVVLSKPGWFSLCHRARTVAQPPIGPTSSGEQEAISKALMLLDRQTSTATIEKTLKDTALSDLTQWLGEATDVHDKLAAFPCKTSDGSEQVEFKKAMQSLIDAAHARQRELSSLLAQRQDMGPPTRPAAATPER